MDPLAYKIESTAPIVASLPGTNVRDGYRLANRELAVSLAAKSITDPPGGVVRVVHVPTGEVLFSKVSGWGDLEE
ncbi:hypothetical protein GCM10027399_20420 [Curvibacter fontanus]|jgi:hypothetical protein